MRAATHALHRDLDTLIGRFTDLAAYTRYLMVSTAFRGCVETELRPDVFAGVGVSAPMSILRELLGDCRDLGLLAPARTASVGLRENPSEQIGAAYVLEGSCMGAQMLVVNAGRLGMSGDFGARHLAKQVAMVSQWQSFLQQFEKAETFDLDTGIAGARKVFEFAITLAEARRDAE